MSRNYFSCLGFIKKKSFLTRRFGQIIPTACSIYFVIEIVMRPYVFLEHLLTRSQRSVSLGTMKCLQLLKIQISNVYAPDVVLARKQARRQ